jgi:GTP:adenosylcobinamide-phosphate guanylyltransferase
MEAVVLAGGSMPPALVEATDATERALIEVGGRTMLSRVLDSLREVPAVTRIICVGTPGVLASLESDIVGLESGDKLTKNLLKGAREAKSERILIVTADAPLVSGRTWMQFLDGAALNSLEAAYSIVRKADVEAQFPGGTRTYGHLGDGSFTGGNAFLVPREKLNEMEALIEKGFAARKNPFALARILGLGFIFRALTKKLTIGEIEHKVSSLLGCRSGAVIVPDAAIAFDVDKASDLVTAREMLARKEGMARAVENAENGKSK